MGLWKRVEEIFWTGDVVKDYGLITEGSEGGARRKVSVLLAGKGRRAVFIRVSHRATLAGSVSFVELDRDAVRKLDAALHDAMSRM